jgi:hypothetical protein
MRSCMAFSFGYFEHRIAAPHNSFRNNVCLYSKGPPVPDGH